jgi:hypothetical protein
MIKAMGIILIANNVEKITINFLSIKTKLCKSKCKNAKFFLNYYLDNKK